jgi:magnesium and cobalt transporter
MSERPTKSPRSWLERLRLFSGEPQNRQDLKYLLRDAEQRQVVDGDALSIMEGALRVADMQVREIMIPRTQIIWVNANEEPQDWLPKITESAHSRFPVIGENKDEVLGVLLAKDLLQLIGNNSGLDKFRLKDMLRPATFVPESKRLNVLLKEFRATRNHMAIVIDEYGGIAGLVTIEDVLEQIVGEIEDEHDFDEEDSFIKAIEKDVYMVKALTPIEDFNQTFKTKFSEEDFDTIGGIVMDKFGRLPDCEDIITISKFKFKVVNANSRQIHLLEVTPMKA